MFFLAMVSHPHVQAKAQEQIDSVLGAGRLPQFDDLPSMPYVEAIMMELMRWQPAVPVRTYYIQ